MQLTHHNDCAWRMGHDCTCRETGNAAAESDGARRSRSTMAGNPAKGDEGSDVSRQAVIEALQNVMGHVDTPIGRRRLGINDDQPEWLVEARGVLRDLENESRVVKGARPEAGVWPGRGFILDE